MSAAILYVSLLVGRCLGYLFYEDILLCMLHYNVLQFLSLKY